MPSYFKKRRIRSLVDEKKLPVLRYYICRESDLPQINAELFRKLKVDLMIMPARDGALEMIYLYFISKKTAAIAAQLFGKKRCESALSKISCLWTEGDKNYIISELEKIAEIENVRKN